MTEHFDGLELQLEKLVPGGEALARMPDGRVLLVRGGAPADRIRLFSAERQRGAWRAVGYELVAPGPERVSPECAVAESCGGCDLMHLTREGELRHKRAMLKEALARTGGVALEPPPLVSAGSTLGYRSRVRFHIGKGGKLGLFSRGTHELVEVPGCLVADQRINAALQLLRRLARRFPDALGGFSDVELRAQREGVTARFMPRDGIRPVSAEPFLRALGRELSVAASEREAAGTCERRELPGDVYVEIAASAFSQINVEVNRKLVEAVLDGARKRGLASFCDLFAGAGNFALSLARQGLQGVMVEKMSSAAMGAERALAAQGLDRVRVRTTDAARALRDLVREGRRFDLVVLDPPREGAAEVVAGVPQLGPRAVAYVACDPVTLSRDLKILLSSGLRAVSIQGFDMFPRTHHFETLVWLEP